MFPRALTTLLVLPKFERFQWAESVLSENSLSALAPPLFQPISPNESAALYVPLSHRFLSFLHHHHHHLTVGSTHIA